MMVFLKKLHKWVGLLIGIQVLLWLLSGLMLSLINPEKVSGAKWAQPSSQTPQTIPDGKLLEPHELTVNQLNGALSISLEVSRGQMVYRIRRSESTSLINASNGSAIVTDEHEARILAQQDFTGNGEITSIKNGTAPGMETRDSTGVYWRVNFSDKARTSIYVYASTGDILERRNSYWRVFDFFWMLHIMDYSGHEDINNTLIIIVALIAIWLGASGFILLFGSFNRHDFWFLNIPGYRNKAVISLIDPALNIPQQVRLRKGSNLFVTLATHHISLPSHCGGGGECGKCRVKFEAADLPEANPIELGLVPKPLRKKGYRLACQQEVKNNITLHLPKGTLVPEET
jgi:ferredoxin